MELPKSIAASIRFLCLVMRPDGDCPDDSQAKQHQKGDSHERLTVGVINFIGRPCPSPIPPGRPSAATRKPELTARRWQRR